MIRSESESPGWISLISSTISKIGSGNAGLAVVSEIIDRLDGDQVTAASKIEAAEVKRQMLARAAPITICNSVTNTIRERGDVT